MNGYDVDCNLCGSAEREVVFPAGKAQPNQVVRCRACGLMYASPRLGELDHVNVSKYDPAFVEELLKRSDSARLHKERLQVRDYDGTRKMLRERFPHRGKLVEIGSGLGFLLQSFAAEGWDVTGIDPDPVCCEHARKVFGLQVLDGILPKPEIASGSVDVVVMMHVIEHVPDPQLVLREIHRVLKPDGLLVLETPRYDTLSFRLLRHRERSVSCAGHVYFFTSRTLEASIKAAGFSLVRRDYVGRSLTMDRLLWNLAVVSKSLRIERLAATVSRKLHLDKVHLKINVRDMQRIYVTKPRALAP